MPSEVWFGRHGGGEWGLSQRESGRPIRGGLRTVERTHSFGRRSSGSAETTNANECDQSRYQAENSALACGRMVNVSPHAGLSPFAVRRVRPTGHEFWTGTGVLPQILYGPDILNCGADIRFMTASRARETALMFPIVRGPGCDGSRRLHSPGRARGAGPRIATRSESPR
jgi:hypothetical protein